MASPEYLRYYDDVIRLLAQRGHSVRVAVNKPTRKKLGKLDHVLDGSGRVTSAGIVPKRGDVWYSVARGIRGTMDYVRYLDPRFCHAESLRARMRRKALPRVFGFLEWTRSLPRGVVERMLRGLRTLELAVPSSRTIETFIEQQRPDVVLVSPMVDAASDQVDIIKSARQLRIPAGVCVASWDNLTNKGLLRGEPDAVFVWNEVQRAEAVELHGVPASKVVVTGAQVFDRWFGREPTLSREAFCRAAGFAGDQEYILFVCSSAFIVGAESEVDFVRAWLAAIRASEDPRVRRAGVLIRPYPYKADHWRTIELSEWGGVTVWPRAGFDPVRDEVREGFFYSLYYSLAVVGINTSAMIEAAIVGRPVFTIMSPTFAGSQAGTVHFHYLLPENGGFVRVATGLAEHVSQLSKALREPEATRAAMRQFVAGFVRPHGMDRTCTPVVCDAIERLGRGAADRAVPERSRGLTVIQAGLWTVATLDRARRQLAAGRRLRRWVKRIRSVGRRARRQVGATAARMVRRLGSLV